MVQTQIKESFQLHSKLFQDNISILSSPSHHSVKFKHFPFITPFITQSSGNRNANKCQEMHKSQFNMLSRVISCQWHRKMHAAVIAGL